MERSQMWISTIIYMLIGLTIISALLIAVKPKIEESRDRFTIKYVINALDSLDSLINEVNEVIGTKRVFEIKISKGKIKIIPQGDIIEYEIITNFKFSEPNKTLKIGNINLITKEEEGKIRTRIWINYSESNINITTMKNEEGKNITITPSETKYKLWIENIGPPIETSPTNIIYLSVE